MNGEKIMRALTEIDDRFVIQASDEEYIKAVFSDITKNSEHSHSPTRRITVKRLMLIAIIGLLIIALSIGITAKFFNINLRDELYEIIGNEVKLDNYELSATADSFTPNTSKLVEDLKEKGFKNILLPEMILNDEWQFEYLQFYADFPDLASANIRMHTDKGIVSVVMNYNEYPASSTRERTTNFSTVVKMEEMQVNGVDVVIVNYEYGNSDIIYMTIEENEDIVTETTYHICFNKNYTFEEVVEAAKTIR